MKLNVLWSPAALCIWAICACIGYSIAESNASRIVTVNIEAKTGGTSQLFFPIEMRRWDEPLFRLLTTRKRAEIEEAIKAAEQKAGGDQQAGSQDMPPYVQTTRYYEQFRAYTLVSFLEVSTVKTADNHVSYAFKTVNFDKAARKELTLQDIFDGATDRSPPLDALSNYVRADLRDRLGSEDDSDALMEATKADLAIYERFTFCPSTKPDKAAGLTIHLLFDGSSPFGAADFHITVPYTVFAKFIKPGLKGLFAGEPRQVPVDLQDMQI